MPSDERGERPSDYESHTKHQREREREAKKERIHHFIVFINTINNYI